MLFWSQLYKSIRAKVWKNVYVVYKTLEATLKNKTIKLPCCMSADEMLSHFRMWPGVDVSLVASRGVVWCSGLMRGRGRGANGLKTIPVKRNFSISWKYILCSSAAIQKWCLHAWTAFVSMNNLFEFMSVRHLVVKELTAFLMLVGKLPVSKLKLFIPWKEQIFRYR